MSHPQFNPSVRDPLSEEKPFSEENVDVTATATMNSMNDTALLECVMLGDKRAMSELYDRLANISFAVAQRILSNQRQAEEITEEILLHIWRQPSSYLQARCELWAWVSLSARIYAQEVLRARGRTVTMGELLLPDPHELTLLGTQTWRQDRLKLVVANLPNELQTLMEMAWFKRMGSEEIARQTGLPIETVRLRIQSALKTLQRALELHE